jgi:hypothetical protein
MTTRWSLSFAFVVGLFPACDAGRGRPADPSGQEDIYGKDSRRELDDPRNPEWVQEAGDAVALVIDQTDLEDTDDGFVLGATLLSTQRTLCGTERFADQPAIPARSCTGFLIAPDRLVTAGHCIDDKRCAQRAFVFGFAYRQDDHEITQVNPEDVYFCERVLARELVPGDDGWSIIDYAIVELDRVVDGRPPLVLSPARLPDDARLALIGHPEGLPMKVDFGRVVTNWEPFRFFTDLDANGGNSGSPLLDRDSEEVVGILTGGTRDWVWNEEIECYDSHHCDTAGDEGCEGQLATRANVVAEEVAGL